ncbi:hypothetical protein RFI_11511 [Reticulomyxa filosa]|uniref:Myotubularin phosphatase domain-containing protein n=1 Tax=Reticulomyxa filosa TaxID=46433 RepID=X6NJU2_RETFI|nr:hypothetical protein RFI_11511 [Reticulomyxa filosa]|eukprot:ETO25627.1 hypothetical protein RFI_11511 [Reticulomyxa filosa]
MSRRSMSQDLTRKNQDLRKATEGLAKSKRKATNVEDERERRDKAVEEEEGEESTKLEMNILAKKWSYVFEDEILHRDSFHNDHKTSSFRATYVLSRNNKVDVCSEGHLTVTNYLLFFEPDDDNTLPGGSHHLIFPLSYICRLSVKERPKVYPTKSTSTVNKDNASIASVSTSILNTTSTSSISTSSSNHNNNNNNNNNNNTTTPVDVFELEFTTRRYRPVKFQVDKSLRIEALMEMLRMLIFPSEVHLTFAFTYARRHPIGHKFLVDRGDSKEKESPDGEVWSWSTYNVYEEFKRMGVDYERETESLQTTTNTGTNTNITGGSRYRCTKVNTNYEICDTYPQTLYVPAAVIDEDIKQVALFRKKGRIPAMTWKERHSNVAMFRCSQPQVGVTGQRSNADEWMIEKIVEANDSVRDSILYVMDARPKLNAQLNKAKGAGFENASFYKNIIIDFLNIPNIHVMRKSRQALSRIIHTPKHKDKDWLVQLANTEWLQYIRKLLKGTYKIVSVIKTQQCSVLCHCSDGWDRTSQLCCLAQLCMDGYYRTLKGFIVLIEKDWLYFGHQFDTRIGHRLDDANGDDERSPVFEQFIDCVWQLTQQFPTLFQFTPNFLLVLLDHVYSCRFGTFLGSCPKQREQWSLHQHTLSLWTFLQNSHHSASFVNCFYRPNTFRHTIFPLYHSKSIRFWNDCYLRHCPEHIMHIAPEFAQDSSQDKLLLQLKLELEEAKKENALLLAKVRANAHVVEQDMD